MKNTITASFQAQIGWKRQRKRENKNYRSVSFFPDRQEKIPKKIAKTFQKLKNTITSLFTSQNRLKKAEK